MWPVALVLALSLDPQATPDMAKLLASANTVCIVVPANAPAVYEQVGGRLTAWGRLRVVTRPDDADLVLEVSRISVLQAPSEQRHQEPEGARFAARLTHRASGLELWRTVKGGSWSLSTSNGAWAGRAIADAFIKYFEKTARPAVSRPPSTGAGGQVREMAVAPPYPATLVAYLDVADTARIGDRCHEPVSSSVHGGTCRSGIGGAANSRRHGRASQRAHREARFTRALSVAIPVLAYIWR
jgi:hypothetical protein